MAKRYVSPPGWPAPPAGWSPPPGWQPDPAWGPAPEGWQFWQQEGMGTGAKLGIIGGSLALALVACTASLAAIGGSSDPAPDAAEAVSVTPAEPSAAPDEPVEDIVEETEVPAVAPASEWPTCEDLVPDVVAISQGQDSLYTRLLQVYEPEMTADRTADFDAGTLEVPEGETSVVVLECTGTGAWDDSTSSGVDFELQVDLNGDHYVALEAVEAAG